MISTYLPHYEWAAVLGSSLILWCYFWVMPRYGVFGSSLLGYLGISSLWVWVWVQNRYYTINPYDQMALRYFSVDSLARALMLIVPLMALSKSALFKFGKMGAKLFTSLNSLWIIIGFALTKCVEVNSCGGIGNPSIMVGLSVCLLPVVSSIPIFILVALSVLLSKSSIALGLLTLYVASVFLKKKAYAYALAAAPLPLIAGYYLLGWQELINSSDRFMIWAYMMPKWATWWNFFTGTGWGTYHVFSINLQKVQELRIGTHWNTLHNDWLQMVFECGVFGAFLMAGTYLSALVRCVAKREFSVSISLLLYGIYMGLNPALHHAIPALFGAWLFIYALKRQPTEGVVYA